MNGETYGVKAEGGRQKAAALGSLPAALRAPTACSLQPTACRGRRGDRGLTLVELIVAFTILLILTTAALPLARVTVKRERERELRYALRQMREAIDRYKDAADRGLIQVKVGSEGYPPDLETLVNGVNIVGQVDKKFKFLRRIPRDPMTNSSEWGLRSMQDDPKSTSFGGQNVFDVSTKSQYTALDGSKYSDW